MSKICYIMGKSSSGKDTIFKRLKERRPEFRTITLYTTRPIREGETDGVEYHFTDESGLKALEDKGCVIEVRAYNTKCGIWKYFTADDGQIDLEKEDYIVIGTLQSFEAMCRYFGRDKLLPVYVEVEDGLRLKRALDREMQQNDPKYAEMCRRFLADRKDFSEEHIKAAGIERRFSNEDIEECLDEIEDYLNENL